MLKFSFNITTRNDDYFEDNIDRLTKTINTNLFFLDKIDCKSFVEFNIIDWGSENPLSKNVKIYDKFKNDVNFFHIDKKMADKVSSSYVNNFNMNIPANLAVRLSRGEFIIQATDDQLFSKMGWYNLINIINNRKKFELDTNKILFYIPRKIIEFDFYKKNPSTDILDEFFKYNNSTYFKPKSSTFYFGGGYSLLCEKKLLENLGGIMNENNNPISGNDGDLNIRIKRLGINQIDTSSLGFYFYKFPAHPKSKRTKLLKETKLTRQFPPLPRTNYPNDENWGMANEKVVSCPTSKTFSNFENINDRKFFLSKKNSVKLNFSKKLSILSKFLTFKYNIAEWNLVFTIIKLIGSCRIFSLIEYGFDNYNRLISIGQEFKSLEILSVDNNSDKSDYHYLSRLAKVQNYLSEKRYGKFVALNSSSFLEFKNCIENIKYDCESNLFLVNSDSVNHENQKKIQKELNELSDRISFVILWSKKNFFINIDEKFVKLKSNNCTQIYLNKNLVKDYEDNTNKILTNFNSLSLIALMLIYTSYNIYKFIAKKIKFLHYKIFRFKY